MPLTTPAEQRSEGRMGPRSCRARVLATASVGLLALASPALANEDAVLSFGERVAAQAAIERVFYEHRIWPKDNRGAKPSFEEAMSETVLRAKVDDSLRKGAALEAVWQRPVTDGEVQAELDRMVRSTRDPAMLQQLFDALGNDPLVVAECLVRPGLTDRMIRANFYSDKALHAATRASAQAAADRIADAPRLATGDPNVIHVLYVTPDSPSSRPKDSASSPRSRAVINVSETELENLRVLFGRCAVRLDENECDYTVRLLERSAIHRIEVALRVLPKLSFEAWWQGSRDLFLVPPEVVHAYRLGTCTPRSHDRAQSPPLARSTHTAVWTGVEMIVWGGAGGASVLNSGGRYTPAMDTWAPTSKAAGCPSPRWMHTAVWTGAEMIVWGGSDFTPQWLSTGGRYSPATDSWSPTDAGPTTPPPRDLHTAVWTGTSMIVWGGGGSATYNSGGRYDPTSDSWTPTSTGPGCPSPRGNHTAVWTGTEMVVWGGGTGVMFGDGGRYDPSGDVWASTTMGQAPSPRAYHSAVWTGTEMIVWGGYDSVQGIWLKTGSRYDPGLDKWSGTRIGGGCPSPRFLHTAIWTGNEMIVWGGAFQTNTYYNDGGRYAPSSNTWIATNTGAACPLAREGHSAVWTGREMVVWGGANGSALDTMGRYYPPPDSWVPRDFVVGAGMGPSNPNRVRVATSAGSLTGVDFLAYGANAWGVNVAGVNATGDPYDQILTGPGPGSTLGPQVRAFDGTGTSLTKVNFYSYGTLKYGVNVASSNLDADVYDEILSGAGPGVVFGPHVRGWSFDNTSIQALTKLSYFAYGTLKYGVNVASGDVDGDSVAEVVTGPGPGPTFGPQVRGWNYDGNPVVPLSKINFNAFGTPRYGANVAVGDVDGDGYAEIAASPGPGAGASFPSEFKGFNYDNAPLAPLPGFDVTPFATTYGGRVGLGDISMDVAEDLVAGAGRDPGADATVKSFTYNGASLSQLPNVFLPFATFYGVTVATSGLDY